MLGFDSVRLYDLIYRGSWTLLAFTGSGSSANVSATAKAIHDLRRAVPTFIVSTDNGLEADGNVLYDLDEVTHRVYGVTHPTLFLVRQEGHIGAKIQPSQVQQLSAYMKHWAPDASQAFEPLPSGRRRSISVAG